MGTAMLNQTPNASEIIRRQIGNDVGNIILTIEITFDSLFNRELFDVVAWSRTRTSTTSD